MSIVQRGGRRRCELDLRTRLSGALLAIAVLTATATAVQPSSQEMTDARNWVTARFEGRENPDTPKVGLLVLANLGPVQQNSKTGAPLKIGDKSYTRGLFCHANSKVIVRLPGPAKEFTAVVGVEATAPPGTVIFIVGVNGKEAFRSPVMRGTQPGLPIKVDLQGATEFILEVNDSGDNVGWDQSHWADAKVTLFDGKESWLGEMPFLGAFGAVDSTAPPFSFKYDGRPSSQFLHAWRLTRSTHKLDDHRTEHIVIYIDSATGLQVRSVGIEYHDFPTVEWTLHLKNTGSVDTPLIEDLRPLDIGLERGGDGEYLLHHHKGSSSGQEDYRPIETLLAPGSDTVIAASNGRPTEENMPYFNIAWPGQGMIAVLGWPGQWSSQFIRDSAVGLRIRGGQELTHFVLHPGEEIRTPLVVLQFYRDDWIRAQNIWRRWMIAHSLPKPGGTLQPPHLAGCSSHQFAEMQNANEENQKLFIDRYLEEKLPLDYWWMDAGWYINYGSWMNTGTWIVDQKRFPNGLRAISDHAHFKGVKTIVWFEPECVTPKTWIADNHPDWVHGPEGWSGKGHDDASAWCLLNLGNPDARRWLTDMLDKTITEQGIDLYRQDFRLGPIGTWRANDAEDRQGITEIRHCEGYLANWDELQSRHPKLPIDSCAAGGRRNELEAMRRAVPLLRSDYILEPLGNQCHTYGISFWLPLYGTGVNQCDAYSFRSVMCPMLNACYDVRNRDLDYAGVRKLMGQWKQVSQYMLGDYYPLTPYSTENHVWIAWQFDQPEKGEGMVMAFRRPASFYVSCDFALKGLEPMSRYNVTDLDTESFQSQVGRDLMEKGLRISIPDKPGSSLIVYSKAK